MVKEHYLLSAKNLNSINRIRIDSSRSLIEEETDDLFFWIMSRLEESIISCTPARNHHNITVSVDYWEDDYPILKCGQKSYCPMHVKGNTFYDVMQNVVNIFNDIGKSKSHGYYFNAIYTHINFKSDAKIVLLMSTIAEV